MKKNSFLMKLYRMMILVLPAVLFFSYYPVIKLGASETMNFELSLPLMWLVVFDILAFVVLVQKKLLFFIFKGWEFLLFPIFATLSIIWSQNVMRGILTAGVLWLVYFAIFSFWILKDELGNVNFRQDFRKWFFGSTLLVCVWCLVQCVLDVAGVSREYTLMCAGCVSQSFGFPHPNGFAIEPQFMGNLLLAPVIVTGMILVTAFPTDAPRIALAKFLYPEKHVVIKIVSMFFCFVATLFLTFSRGAIYAFAVAMVFMSVMMIAREKAKRKKVVKRVGIMWGIIVLAFLFTLNLQGIFAQTGPTKDTYMDGVAKALNHLSLGIIDIRENNADGSGRKVENENDVKGEVASVNNNDDGGENEAIFDGYVEESTEIRKMLTRNALTLWRSDIRIVFLGVGLGGAGQAMYRAGLIDSPKEIVQNQYASLLLEVGIVGVLFLVFMIVLILKMVVKNAISPMLLILVLAYGVTLVFFAGLPNALQIYLLPAALLCLNGRKL